MKYETIKRNNDFVRAYKKGKKYYNPYLVVYVNKNWHKKTRIGITCSKKVGNAVMRNRARRVIRAALYEFLPADSGAYDIVIVANNKTPLQKSTDISKGLKKIFKKAGLLSEN